MRKGFFIGTMGCQMNEYDSDYLAESLINAGYSPVSDPGEAEVILVNTCAVRAKPEQKAFSFLGRMAELKRKRPNVILGIAGCVAQREGAHIMRRFPLIDLVMGPREIEGIGEYVRRIKENGEKIVATDLSPQPAQAIACNGYFKERVTAYVSIMQGCDNFCSYCIVPFVRGREVSRSPNDILREAEGLVSSGVKEITLIGQNVNSYRWDDGELWRFPKLIRHLSETEGLLRIRFTTSHPKDLSTELIRCFGEVAKLCGHIHLPFQAGSNEILRHMRRGYTREEYMALVEQLRTVNPDISITSDVMVGFPGESQEDFELTLDLIKRIEFDSLFSFKYSDRKDTLAEKMPKKVKESEKATRLAILQELQKEITGKKNRALEGKVLEVLVDGQSKRGGQLSGRSCSNKVINFTSNKGRIGDLVKVKVKHAFINSLSGEPI